MLTTKYSKVIIVTHHLNDNKQTGDAIKEDLYILYKHNYLNNIQFGALCVWTSAENLISLYVLSSEVKTSEQHTQCILYTNTEDDRGGENLVVLQKFPLEPLAISTRTYILIHCFHAEAKKSRQWNIVIANRCQAQLSRSNECETEMSTFCPVTATITTDSEMKEWWEIDIKWFCLWEIISWLTVDWFHPLFWELNSLCHLFSSQNEMFVFLW